MIDILLDTLFDSLKLLPFLFLAFLLLEYLEHKMNSKTEQMIKQAGKFGPILGGVLGAVPQCGFSAMASNLYATRVITLGTLIAIYLSTSDEMLIIMLSNPDSIGKGLIIVLIKLVIGIIAGVVIDLILNKFKNRENEHIHDFCEIENCHCDHGIFRSALYHTFKILLFIAVITLALNICFHYFGEDAISSIMLKGTVFAPFASALLGLIPNCAASVIITEMYLANTLSFGSCLAGLLASSGVGLLILFRVNKPIKQNVYVTLTIYILAVAIGIAVDLLSIAI